MIQTKWSMFFVCTLCFWIFINASLKYTGRHNNLADRQTIHRQTTDIQTDKVMDKGICTQIMRHINKYIHKDMYRTTKTYTKRHIDRQRHIDSTCVLLLTPINKFGRCSWPLDNIICPKYSCLPSSNNCAINSW